MHCNEAQKKSSAYLDAELSAEQSAAVRGHLRSCDTCRLAFEDEAQLIESAKALEVLTPPPHLWKAIAAKVAEEEVSASRVPFVRRWIKSHFSPVSGISLAGLGLACVAGFWMVLHNASENTEEPRQQPGITLAKAAHLNSHTQGIAEEVDQAHQDYTDTISELYGILEEDREEWSDARTLVLDTHRLEFEKNTKALVFSLGGQALSIASRDLLFAGYQQEIGYLHNAISGQFPQEPF